MAELTFAQIMERRQHEMHEREVDAQRWSQEVTEQLANQRSKFLEDFTAEQKRIFGVLDESL